MATSNRPPWLPAEQSQPASQPARAAFVPQGASTFQSPWLRTKAQQQAHADQNVAQPAPADQQNRAQPLQNSWQQAPAQHPVPAWPLQPRQHQSSQPQSPSINQNAWQQTATQQHVPLLPMPQPDDVMHAQYESNEEFGSGMQPEAIGESSNAMQDLGSMHTQPVPAAASAAEHELSTHPGPAANAIDPTSPSFMAATRLRDLNNEIKALQVRMQSSRL